VLDGKSVRDQILAVLRPRIEKLKVNHHLTIAILMTNTVRAAEQRLCSR